MSDEYFPITINDMVERLTIEGWSVSTQSPLFSPMSANGEMLYAHGTVARAERRDEVIRFEGDTHDDAIVGLYKRVLKLSNEV